MFPRAARFDPTKPSDTPGPNSYDPTDVVAHYKKGLLNQKDARFKGNSHALSDEGPSTSSAALLTPAQIASTKSKTDALLLKEKSKWSAKLAKSEERINDLERQTHALMNENSQAKADLRLAQQQVEKLQAQVSKMSGQASKNDTSHAKLAGLQRSHDQIKARRKADEEMWKTKCSQIQNERDKLEASNARMSASQSSSQKELQALQSRELTLQEHLRQERKNRTVAEQQSSEAESRSKKQGILLQQMVQEQRETMLSVESLNDLIEEGREALEEQRRQRRSLERVAAQNAMEVKQLSIVSRESSQNQNILKMEHRRIRFERDTAYLEVDTLLNRIASLESELQIEKEMCQEAWMQVDVALDGRRGGEVAEMEETPDSDVNHEQSDDREAEILHESSELLLRLSDMAWRDECEWSDGLEATLDDLQEQYLNVLIESATLQETQRALEKAKQELESVEEAYEKGLLEVMRAHKGEEEVKRELSQSRAANDGLASRLRQLEKISKKVLHAKMKEEAWLQEREELLQELERSSHFEGEYKSLRSQAQLLLSRSNLYEVQMEELSALNTVLASHTNPSQKIFYLDRIRKELDEKRIECQVLVVERDDLQSQCKGLQAKLDLFCKVESRLEDRPRTAFRRVAREPVSTMWQSISPEPTILVERSPNRSPRAKVRQQQQSKASKDDPRARSVPGFRPTFNWAKGGKRFGGDEEGDLTLDDLLVGI